MKAIYFLVLLGFSVAVQATNLILTEEKLDPAHFPQAAQTIRENLDNPALMRLSEAQKSDVLVTLERLQSALAEGAPPTGSRVQAMQRRINRTLTPAMAPKQATSDVVCERVLPVGSRIPRTECKTRSERDQEQYLAQEWYRRATQEKKSAD